MKKTFTRGQGTLTLVGFLVASILLASLVVNLYHPPEVRAHGLHHGNFVVTTLTYGTDSSATVSRCVIYRLDGSTVEPQDADSIGSASIELNGSTADALSRFVLDTVSNFDADYNPAYFAIWYMSDGQRIRDNACNVTPLHVWSVDSIRQALTVSAAGTGPYVCSLLVIDTSGTDDTLTYADVTVKDLSGTLKSSVNTGGDGWGALAQVSNENLTFAVAAEGYFQESLDTVAYPAKDTLVTLKVYNFVPNVPSTGDSCTLVFYLPSVAYRAVITPMLQGVGEKTTTGWMIDPKAVTADPDATTLVAQKAVLRSSAASPQLEYRVQVLNKYNREVLLEIDNYVVPDSVTHVVTW